ncbi:4-hydroxybenzoate polyprenyltransferase [Thermodesulfobium acidiphilum]|uniref:4-hydroxybenzoate polyprenyltransferase n=1 Tax=Thermodesulfobium acidiphilum TaxID=1794699 RepID=A0A2R4W1W9_THEAF|nr:UbiA-like polyprenyltransferase [Thermodesulfobium acidiphilum]AWB10797.1 4-hydroxybenzoate polyprenyltransferase [Thermodesulfobium acidiphilum]
MKLTNILNDIRVEHTVFSLPFLLASAFIASNGFPEINKLILIVLALLFARAAAMSFNRFADANIDKFNPRTAKRSIPKGAVKRKDMFLFVCFCSTMFILTSYLLGNLTFLLSPVALFIVFFYSYTKRFTALSHIVLGLALSLAPGGAWIALRNDFGLVPFFMMLAVVFWLAGFDVLYSLQDLKYDIKQGLHSIPVAIGEKNSLYVARLFHSLTILFLSPIGIMAHINFIYYLGLIIFAGLLLYEHSLVKPNDLSKIDMAFFNVNAICSFIYATFVIFSVLIK